MKPLVIQTWNDMLPAFKDPLLRYRHTFQLYEVIAKNVRGTLGAKETVSGSQGRFDRKLELRLEDQCKFDEQGGAGRGVELGF